MAPARVKAKLLARVNFPLYTVRMLTNRHVLVAGGGGSAKTGIANAIEIYELSCDGKECRAQPSTRHETGDHAIMNCTTFHNGRYYVLAAGMEGDCQLYQLKFRIRHSEGEIIRDNIIEEGGSQENGSLRKRRCSKEQESSPTMNGSAENVESSTKPKQEKRDRNRNSVSSLMGFSIIPTQCIQTDFNVKEEPFQKVVRVSFDHKFLVTGGSDGHLRTWQYPEMKQKYIVEAHKDEIDDLDISPCGKKIVSISRDGHAYVWDANDGKLQSELVWCAPAENSKYRYRNCRFGIVERDRNNYSLFTAHIPGIRQKNPLPCYLTKWDTTGFVLKKMQSAGADVLSSMAISDDGRFLAVGTMSGNVDIYIAFSLQWLQHTESAHNIFVTGLEFIPTSEDMPQITGDFDASLISVSVDNQIKIHHIPKLPTISIFWILLLFIAIMFILFSSMSYLGL